MLGLGIAACGFKRAACIFHRAGECGEQIGRGFFALILLILHQNVGIVVFLPLGLDILQALLQRLNLRKDVAHPCVRASIVQFGDALFDSGEFGKQRRQCRGAGSIRIFQREEGAVEHCCFLQHLSLLGHVRGSALRCPLVQALNRIDFSLTSNDFRALSRLAPQGFLDHSLSVQECLLQLTHLFFFFFFFFSLCFALLCFG